MAVSTASFQRHLMALSSEFERLVSENAELKKATELKLQETVGESEGVGEVSTTWQLHSMEPWRLETDHSIS